VLQLLKKYKLIIALIILVIGWIIYVFVARYSEHEELIKEAFEDSIFPVSIIQAQETDDIETLTLPGNVEAWYQAYIYARVNGYVEMWFTDYGAKVKKGEKMAEIQAPALDAEYAQAKADMKADQARYELAKLTADRYLAMKESNAVSIQSISVKEADAKAEEANLEAAKYEVKTYEAKLKFKTIVSPYDGVVTARNINVGDYIEGNIKEQNGENYLFKVADIHKMRIFVSVPERFGAFLKPGLKADIVLPQYPHRHYTADFLTVANGFDPETRTAVTEFILDNKDESIWPGSYAQVTISADTQTYSLSIPTTAMVFAENGTQVAIVDGNNTVHFKSISVAKLNGRTIDVSEGITQDDKIINNPSAALLDGSKVKVIYPTNGYFNQPPNSDVNTSEQSNGHETDK
jgi:RND family efflux transporter MFP subunit